MKAAKLFHAIVIAGAAITGCGDDDDRLTDAVADAGSTDAGAFDGGSRDAAPSDMGLDAAAAIDAAMRDDAGSEEDAFVAII